MNNDRLAALMMSVLIITIPFCISSAYAESFLHVKSVAGTDGLFNENHGQIEGFRRYYDTLTVDVDAAISNDSQISTNQLKFGTYWFTSCSAGSPADCKYIETGYRTGTSSYMISLRNDTGTNLRGQSVVVTTDNVEPAVTVLSANPKLTNGLNISIDYTVEDYAISQGDTSKCVGISKIEFFKDDFTGALLGTVEPTDKTQCSISGKFKFTSTDASGQVKVCAKATDRFSQTTASAVCDTFTIDKTAPVFRSVRIIRQDNGLPLRFIGQSEIPVRIIANLSGTDIDTSSIVADISDLNGPEEIAPTSIVTIRSNTIATWNLPISLSQSKAPSIKVTAKDRAGNSLAPDTLSAAQIVFDTTGPVVTAVRTNIGQFSGKWLVAKNVTFYADVSENSGNLQNHNVFLDLSGLGLGIVQADNCTGSYTCIWYNKQITVATGTFANVSSTLDSQDDLGNTAIAAKSIGVTIDQSPVQLKNLQISTVHGSIVVPGANYTVKGDKLSITANITETSQVTAFANFSRLIAGANKVPGACSQISDNNWQCSWETDLIDRSGPFTAYVPFYFFDFAGNKYKAYATVFVAGLKNETTPNYWESEVICSPDKIDRQVTSLIAQRLYCNVHLTPNTDATTTLAVALDAANCKNIGNVSSLDYISDMQFMNDLPGTTDPFIKIALKTTEMKVSSLQFTCPMYIMSSTANGRYIVQNPELENVSIKVLFYNLPLTDFSSETQQKIEEVKNSVFVKMSFIDTLQTFMTFAKTICGLITTWNKFVNALNLIVATIGIGTTALPGGNAIGIELRIGVDSQGKIVENFLGSMYKFCKFVNCDITLWGSWYSGYQTTTWKDIKMADQKGSMINLGQMDFAQTKLGFLEKAGIKNSVWPQNPSQSIILSMATGCLPGIIDGLQRWRQIQCNYGVCLRDSTAQKIPLKACEDQKAYLECKYIFGEIFQIIPFAATFKGLLNKFSSIISDPIGLVFAGIRIACSPLVFNGGTFFLCQAEKCITAITTTIVDISNAINSIGNAFKPANDMCKELNKATPQPPKKAAATTPATTTK